MLSRLSFLCPLSTLYHMNETRRNKPIEHPSSRILGLLGSGEYASLEPWLAELVVVPKLSCTRYSAPFIYSPPPFIPVYNGFSPALDKLT